MAGLVPAIHVFFDSPAPKTWMPGTTPGMTSEKPTTPVLGKIPLNYPPIHRRQRDEVGDRRTFIDLVHGLSDQAEFQHRTIILDKARIQRLNRAPRGRARCALRISRRPAAELDSARCIRAGRSERQFVEYSGLSLACRYEASFRHGRAPPKSPALRGPPLVDF